MKKKAGIEREKEENETSGDVARGADETEKERKEEGEEGRKGKGNECLKSIEAGGWSRKRKIVKSARGSSREF